MTHMTLQAVRQLIANDSYAITFQSVEQYRGTLLRHFDSLVEAPSPEWGRVRTVGDMVRNLLTLDQAEPIFSAFHVDFDGARRCRASPISISHERVIDGKWVDSTRKDVPYSTVLWAKPDERAQQAAAPGALTGEVLAQMLLDKHVTDLGYRTLLNGDQIEFNLQELLAIVNTASAAAPSAPGTPEAPAGLIEKDAARYQWLRERWVAWREEGESGSAFCWRKREKLDEWIDRAAQLDGGQGEERSNVCRPAT